MKGSAVHFEGGGARACFPQEPTGSKSRRIEQQVEKMNTSTHFDASVKKIGDIAPPWIWRRSRPPNRASKIKRARGGGGEGV